MPLDSQGVRRDPSFPSDLDQTYKRVARHQSVVAGVLAYNEEMSIAKVVLLARRYVDKVIVCDDGSNDMTAEIASAAGAEVLRHERNLGYGGALATLFARAKEIGAEVFVTIDGDGQHDPAEIPKLAKPILEDESDIVIGSRFIGAKKVTSVPRYRKAGIRIITKLSNATGVSVTDAQSGFRAYSRAAVSALAPTEFGMGASTEILSKAAEKQIRIAEVPINVSYEGDTSTQGPLFHGVDVVFSTIKHLSIRHPLLFYGFPGLLSIVVAVGFWWWTLSVFVGEHRIITNIALIAVASTIVGLILMAVAVILWVIVSVVRERSI